MRRVLLALLSATLLAMAGVAPVAASKPDHSRPGPTPPLNLPAGEVCDFAVTLTSEVDTSTTSVWEDEDGTVRILSRGYASGTATNTEDGIAYTHDGGYRVEVVIHPDGSVDVNASGNLFAWYFAGDPIEGLSESLFAISGRGSESYAPDGSLVSAVFYGGHVVDLCAALEPVNP
jgi:hypothetical protein